jgi:hypothetical protein
MELYLRCDLAFNHTDNRTCIYCILEVLSRDGSFEVLMTVKIHVVVFRLLTGYSVVGSQWPRGVRRGSAAARLLGLRARIPPREWMSVVCVVR